MVTQQLLSKNYNIISIEINKRDFMFFDDKEMISCRALEIKNIIDLYVLINDGSKNFIGEITNIKNNKAYINVIGEIINNNFVYGFSNKPSFSSKVNIIAKEDVKKLNEQKETLQKALDETQLLFDSLMQEYFG